MNKLMRSRKRKDLTQSALVDAASIDDDLSAPVDAREQNPHPANRCTCDRCIELRCSKMTEAVIELHSPRASTAELKGEAKRNPLK